MEQQQPDPFALGEWQPKTDISGPAFEIKRTVKSFHCMKALVRREKLCIHCRTNVLFVATKLAKSLSLLSIALVGQPAGKQPNRVGYALHLS